MAGLTHRYPSVITDTGGSYGGNQLWSSSAAIRQCGCGPVAATDMLIYLSRFHGGNGRICSGLPEGAIHVDAYNRLLERLCRLYFPIVPPFGITTPVLSLGLNRAFLRDGLPYRAHAAMATEKIWDRMETCLRADIPVLLAIGQNFPYVWHRERLSFYVRRADGSYIRAAAAKAHFVAVTGMDGDWLCISSWGKKYYINRLEFTLYVKEHSNSLLSGMVYAENSGG